MDDPAKDGNEHTLLLLSRRAFSGFLLAGAASAVLPGRAFSQGSTAQKNISLDELAAQFVDPPLSAAPHTFWMWMNGNVTREGITLDLEAVRRCGIAGVYIYNVAVGIPRGPIEYGSAEWMALMCHAIAEAARLGLRVAMHNAPGYSGTGGPWIPPEQSMQELVWTETIAESDGAIHVELPKPRVRAGWYRDVYVLAYPALGVERTTMRSAVETALANGRAFPKEILWQGNRANKVRLERQADGQMGTLEIHFSDAFEARAISVYRSPEDPIDPYDGPRDYPPMLTLEVSEDGATYREVATFSMPALRSMNSPGVGSFAAVRGRVYRLRSSRPTWITGVELHAGPRLHGWAGKANGAAASDSGAEAELPAELCIDPAGIRDVTQYLGEDGRLTWAAPAGRWTIVRLGQTTTGEVVAAAPDSGIGLECDKLSKAAVDLHFAKSLEPLFAEVGPLVGTTLKAVLIDSWEAGRQNWTTRFPEYFLEKRGYGVAPYVLAMTGRVIASVKQSNQFLFDIRRTQAEMLAENYYGHFQTRCHALGLELHAEPYGDGTFDSMQVAEHLDLTMGEFWARYTYGAKTYIDLAASATHTLGQPLAGAEAFTGAPITSRWTGHPYALKAEGDRMFTLGINRLVFHTFAHQPHPTAVPGMTMGPFGTHFDRNETWMQEDSGWIRYLTRCQLLLQRGDAVAEVCFLKGEEPMSGVPDARAGRLGIPAGFGVDVVSADSVMQAVVEDGSVSFRPGMRYRFMVLAPVATITLALLQRLALLVTQGMTLITSGIPSGSPSLVGQPETDRAVAQLVAEIWGDLDGKGRRERGYGQGRILLTDSIEQALGAIGIGEEPAFTYSAETSGADLVYGHRQIARDDVFLVSNQRRRAERVVCSFRSNGGRPELWDAESGVRSGVASYERVGGRTQVRLALEPASSVFVVFRRDRRMEASVAVLGDASAASEGGAGSDFCMAAWVQPETYVFPGTSFIAIAEEGTAVYGAGHAICGVAVGQNGVWVYERTTGAPRLVLEAVRRIAGTAHVAVVYRGGQPTIYVEGFEAGTGKVSASVVHPARDCRSGTEPPRYFEGNMTPLEVTGVRTAEELRRMALKGAPATQLPTGMVLERGSLGDVAARAWSGGAYRVSRGGVERTLHVADVPESEELRGPWRMTFAEGLGAPRSLVVPALRALNEDEDFNVRHFSGTVRYVHAFEWTKKVRATDLWLDLGLVNVIAKVRINRRTVGSVWKPPYRLMISEFVRAGTNELEIDVTCLWPNRLIGDEQLPAEAEYDVHGPVKRMPEWYAAGQVKPGPRVTFATWHHYGKDDPLLQSGLIGPVRLLHSVSIPVRG